MYIQKLLELYLNSEHKDPKKPNYVFFPVLRRVAKCLVRRIRDFKIVVSILGKNNALYSWEKHTISRNSIFTQLAKMYYRVEGQRRNTYASENGKAALWVYIIWEVRFSFIFLCFSAIATDF